MAYVQVNHGSALCASAIAGPVFVTAVVAATLYLTLPAPIVIRPLDLTGFAMLLVPATIVGFMIALLPNLIGAGLMTFAGNRVALLRHPPIWLLVGAGLGYAICRLLEPILAPVTFGFVVTAAVCALVCRRNVAFRD